MRREYSLSDSAAKKHIAHFMKLLGAAVIMAVLAAFLGLKTWTTAQYIWVNILLIGVAVFCVNVLANFGGRFDGKENKAEQRKKFLIVSIAVGAAAWLLLTIMGTPLVLSGFIFIADVLLTIRVGTQAWEMLKNMWKMAGDESDQSGNKISYPGEIVLHEVHTSDALTSPFGKILIYKNAVLFVLAEMNNGFVLVNPNGTMELKKTKLIKNEVKENKLSVGTIMSQTEEGAKRMIQLVEDVCKKNQIPVPEFNYNYVLFLPNFEARNVIWDQSSFEQLPSVHFWNADKKYEAYKNKADKVDYFQGRACYNTAELQQILEIMAAQGGVPIDQGSKDAIAAGIAQMCELKQRV